MAQDQNHLVWLDMEMSGLNPKVDRILELAMIVTDQDLNIVAQSDVWVIHQSDAVLDSMDAWNKGTHGKSGLIDKVKASTLSEDDVQKAALEFMQAWTPMQASPMCGNTIHQDRRFMVEYLPQLEAYFHYRNLDVSTLKELAKRWKPEIMKQFKKGNKHEALADIIESIDELKFYREHFIQA